MFEQIKRTMREVFLSLQDRLEVFTKERSKVIYAKLITSAIFHVLYNGTYQMITKSPPIVIGTPL